MDNKDKSPTFNLHGEDGESSEDDDKSTSSNKYNARQDYFSRILTERTLFSVSTETRNDDDSEDDEEDEDGKKKPKKKKPSAQKQFLSSIMPGLSKSPSPNPNKEPVRDTAGQEPILKTSIRMEEDKKHQVDGEIPTERTPNQDFDEAVLFDRHSEAPSEALGLVPDKQPLNPSSTAYDTNHTSQVQEEMIRQNILQNNPGEEYRGDKASTKETENNSLQARDAKGTVNEGTTGYKPTEQLSQQEINSRLKAHQQKQLEQQKTLQEDFEINQANEAKTLQEQRRRLGITPDRVVEQNNAAARISDQEVNYVAQSHTKEEPGISEENSDSGLKPIESAKYGDEPENIYTRSVREKEAQPLGYRENQPPPPMPEVKTPVSPPSKERLDYMPELLASRHETLVKNRNRGRTQSISGGPSTNNASDATKNSGGEDTFRKNNSKKTSPSRISSTISDPTYSVSITTGVILALTILIFVYISHFLI